MVLVCLSSLSYLALLGRKNGMILTVGAIATKQNAIVGGQTSCKDPEMKAFEEYLPDDVDIVSCHSLHGPNVDTHGQPLVSDALRSIIR